MRHIVNLFKNSSKYLNHEITKTKYYSSFAKQKLEIISECFVKPKEIANPKLKEPYYLRAIDILTLNLNPLRKGQLYGTKPCNMQSDFIPKFKKALTVSLVYFYPLVGRFVTEKLYDENACYMYVDCNKGSGVRFIHASVDYTVSDIVSYGDLHPIVDSFYNAGEDSINYDGHTRPLLSVQVNELLDGLFIGISLNHVMADGNSFSHFLSTLSEIFTQLKSDLENEENSYEISISRKPIFNTLIPNGRNGPLTKIPYLKPEEMLENHDPGPLRIKIFRFSSESISMIKRMANEECGLNNNISTFQALTAFIWRSITRARNLQPESLTQFRMAVDIRPRFDPPLPSEYFRSFVMGGDFVYKVDDILNNSLGHVALLVNKLVKMQDKQTIKTNLDLLEEHPKIIRRTPGPNSYDKNNCNRVFFAGSSRYDVYGPDFGLGRAISIIGGYNSSQDGKVVINPGREGAGSVELEINLKPETMNALELDEEFISFVTMI